MPDRALQEKISAYADGELDPIEIRQVEAALASQPELRQFLERTRVLERRGSKAVKKMTPKLDETAVQAAWTSIQARISSPAVALQGAAESAEFWSEKASKLNDVPAVDDKKWGGVWANVQKQTELVRPQRLELVTPVKKPVAAPLQASNVVKADFSRARESSRRWAYWLVSVSAAAAVMLTVGMVWLKNIQHLPRNPNSTPVAMASEVLDNKYFMLVKSVPGVENPVVCFYLKDEEPEKDLFE